MKKQLDTIKFIRDLQVKKRRRSLSAAEKEVKKTELQIGGIDQEIKLSTQQFEEKKEKVLRDLKGKRTSVDALYLLRQKEMANYHLIKEKTHEKNNLHEGLVDKLYIKKVRQKELWDSEKNLIKIEEFIKSEVD